MRPSLKYFLVSLIGRHASLFRIYYTLHPKNRPLAVTRATDIVIEGFPRCANTFSVLAFMDAQDREVCIAHHLHAPQQISLGVEYGLPVLALIREPVSAIGSLITRHDWISVGQAIDRYVRFYSVVLEHRDAVVLADFKTITSDYSRVIRAINQRFGSSYLEYLNDDISDSRVFAEIDALNRLKESASVTQLARPSADRKDDLMIARREVDAHPDIGRAKELYERLRPSCI